MSPPAGVFIASRATWFAERMIPSITAEMPSTLSSSGSVGKATPVATPPKETPAVTASATVRTFEGGGSEWLDSIRSSSRATAHKANAT